MASGRFPFVAIVTGAVFFVHASCVTAGESSVHRAVHSTARLVTPIDGVRPGDPIDVGVYFEIAPEWHLYWVNPGQSGEPPRLRWTSPPDVEAGPPRWPVPQRFEIGGIVNFGYERELLLPLTLPASAAADGADSDLALSVDLTWLGCRADECIPATATLALRAPVSSRAPSPDPKWHPRFAALAADAPSTVRATATLGDDREITLRLLDVPEALRTSSTLDVFPYEAGVVDEGIPATVLAATGSTIEIRLKAAASAPRSLDRLTGIVAARDDEPRVAVAFDATASSAVAPAATDTGSRTPIGTGAALLFAFVGGLLLNLMPCVFPVLSLKVLGFVQRAHGDEAETKAHGWAFTLGVLASFWVLAATLLVVRAGGQQLGWGFQLQSPVFVCVLVYLLLVMSLSLSGMLEVGTSLTGAVGRAGMEEGRSGSFWTGALATVVATPCTAPLMGPALGFALTQPPAVAMAIFSSLGTGMAAPYLMLSYFPSALHRLPRPGPWMERLRQFMAFPLLATAVWLADVFAKQTGEGALVRLLAGAVLLAFAVWLWGATSHGAKRRTSIRMVATLSAVAALGFGVGAARMDPAPRSTPAPHDAFWQPWTPARVAELREQGRTVFVNFTAAWCLTCKVNERAIFARSDVRELFQRHDVVALEADWTNEDAEIQRTLASFGRDGVPLYVVYPPNDGREPSVLPQIPSFQDLETAFRGTR
jgi:thiol:disulfide interchange protein